MPRGRSGYYFYNGPLLEYLGMDITMSAANTFTTESKAAPVAKSMRVGMLMHELLFSFSSLDVVVDLDGVSLYLLKADQATTPYINEDNVLSQLNVTLRMVTSGMTKIERPSEKKFTRPIFFGKSNIWIGMNTVGQGAAKTGYAKIGYTLAQVSAYRIYDALTD